MGISEQPLRISVDLGGVLTKYPGVFRQLLTGLSLVDGVEIHVISDIPDPKKIAALCQRNGFAMVPPHRMHSADFEKHGEMCKAVLIEQLGIHIHIDDHAGYCNHTAALNLFTWPNPFLPYNADDWDTGEEDWAFGRARAVNPNRILAPPPLENVP